MNSALVSDMIGSPRNWAFVGLLSLCLALAVAAVLLNLREREAAFTGPGGRKVDLPQVRKQVSEGALSPRKALYYRKVPR